MPPTPSPTATQAATRTPTQPPSADQGRVFLGYYVPYDPTSWASLEANAAFIDFVVPQSVKMDACGNLGSQDDQTLAAFARTRGIKIVPELATSSEWLNHQILTNEASTARAVGQIVGYVVEKGYDGIDLDLEGVAAADRAAYTAFIARVSGALHDKGKMLTIAIPAKTSDVKTGWAGAYDYAGLAPYVDLVTIMAYAYTTSSSPPGSTAPYAWVEQVARYAATTFPKEKVLLGVAFYGYDWNTTLGGKARALRYPQAQAVAGAYNAAMGVDPTTRSMTFTYIAQMGDPLVGVDSPLPLNHDVSVRPLPACSIRPPTSTPRPTVTPGTPPPTSTPAFLQTHVVWLEDAESVAARIGIAERYGIGGVAAWRLGQEDPAVWPLVELYRRGTAG